MNKEKSYHIVHKVVIAGLFFVCIAAVMLYHQGTKESLQREMIVLDTGWVLQRDKELVYVNALPTNITSASKEALLFRQLPRELKKDTVLVFKKAYQNVHVKVDGISRYICTGFLPHLERKMNTNSLCIIPLEAKDSGKFIEVSFQSPLKNEGVYLPVFYIGTEALMILGAFVTNALTLGITGIITFFAILLFAMCLKEWLDKKRNWRILENAAVLMLLSSIWSISNSEVLYLGGHNEMLLGYVSFNSFMLLPVVLPVLYGNILKNNKTFLYRLSMAAAANFIGQNLLHILGKLQYIQMLPITYLLLLFILFMLIGIIIEEYSKGKSFYAAGFFLATLIFLGFYFLDVLRFFYFVPLDNAKFFRYGVLAFIVVIVWVFAKRIRCYVEVEVENRVYKELALRDTLTHLPNRAALEKRVEALEACGELCPTLTVILMDVNGLKPVNDREGHGAGDRLLCEAAKSIKEAFPEEKDAWYRLGGDEFVVLLTETVLSNEECQRRIAKATEKWIDFKHGPISISCGSKTVGNVKVTKELVQNLMHEADQIMYQNKLQYYQEKCSLRNTSELI